jgi:hypothetical protein
MLIRVGADGDKGPAGSPAATSSPVSTDGWSDYERRYAEWIDHLDLSSIDWAALHRGPMLIDHLAPVQSLQAATANASIIVEGEVVSLAPERRPTSTTVTIRVTGVIKGSAASTMAIIQVGGLEPDSSWSNKPTLVYDEADPLLMPGQSVILFLVDSGQNDVPPVPEAFTGIYYLTSTGVQPLAGNPFGSEVAGMSVSAFIARLR